MGEIIQPSDNVQEWQNKANSNFATTVYRETISRTITVKALDGDFSTIQDAVDSVNKYINSNVVITIEIENVGVFDGMSVEGFFGGGTLILEGESGGQWTVTSLVAVRQCVCVVQINEMTSVDIDSDAFVIASCVFALVDNYINISSAPTKAGIRTLSGARILIKNSTISNREQAMTATAASKIHSQTNSGTNNVIGLSSTGGSNISKQSATQPTGTTPEFTSTGGVIDG